MNTAEFDSLVAPGGLDRRAFTRTALGASFAAAALPVCAQTAIKTDRSGLVAGEVTIDVGGFKMPVYRAVQAGRTNAPVVLVVSEIFGVHEYIADVAARFAARATSPWPPSSSRARATPRATARWPS